MDQPINQNPEPQNPVPFQTLYETGKREIILCFLTLVSGLALANFVLKGGLNLGFAIAAICSLITAAWYLFASGHKGTWYTKSVLALCLFIAAGFARSDDLAVKVILLCFLFVGGNLALCVTAGQNRRSPGTLGSLLDAPRALVLGNVGNSLRGVEHFFRTGGESSRRAGAILVGLGISVPVLAVMIPLLMGADAAFEGLMDQLPEFDIPEVIFTLFYGTMVFIALYNRNVALHRQEKTVSTPKLRKGLHLFTVNTVLGMVCVLYLVYLFSQIAYFSGGFLGILPKGYSTAEYARRGFFEMAWLCAINLGILTVGVGLVSGGSKLPLSTKLLCLFLSLVTLFLVSASCAKMVLYIGTYGLTRLRILTMTVIVFLAITTVVVAVWLFVPRLQYMKILLLTALVMGAAVLWLDVDTQVAKYNVRSYLSGDLSEIDTRHLSSLGDGALPYIRELTQASDPEVAQIARDMAEHWDTEAPEDFRSWNYLTAQASQNP